MYKNIVIKVVENNAGAGHSIIVRADSERYCKNAILYQNITFRSCCEYIARITRQNNFKLKPRILTVNPTWLTPNLPPLSVGAQMYTDFEGKTMPTIMDIVL